MFDPTADIIFADGPAANPNQPQKVLLRKYFRKFEDAVGAGLSNGGLIYDTKAHLDADLAQAANTSAWVISDIPANNGIYRKYGASGTGSWFRIAELPYSVVYAQNDGSGTADAVAATASVPIVTAPYSQLVSVPFTAVNTGPMTLSINGETPRPLVTNTGAAIEPGYVKAGMSALVQIDSAGNYRLFSYGDASAIQLATEALLTQFNSQYLGSYASAPTTDPSGGAIQQGAFYWSTASKTWFYWDGTGWGTFPFATVADGAVTAAKLADDAVTEPKHATGSVSTRALADGSATLAKIGDDAKADFRLVDPNGALPRGTYNGPTSFRVDVDEYAMGGFWFRGRYKQGRARVVATPDTIFDWTTDYGAGTINLKNWQACFLCAKAGDTVAVPKIMPYLRVMSVAGNVITLNKAGEGIDGAVAATDYGWAVNALVGCQCLVISESGQWSRFRTTTVTANTKTTVTLADIGTIGGLFNGAASLDWILIAPPGYAADEFAWVADFYADTAEVRNIYVGGGTARAKMIYILAPSYQTGSVPLPGVWVNAGGYISPLATGLTVDLTSQFSTAATGSFAEYLAGDTGNHILQSAFGQKLTATSESIINDGMHAAFLYHQRFVYANGGSMVSSRSGGQINITGWEY